MFDECRDGKFPRFLLVIGNLTELAGVEAELPGHLDVSMRKAVATAGLKPALQPRRNFFAFHCVSFAPARSGRVRTDSPSPASASLESAAANPVATCLPPP